MGNNKLYGEQFMIRGYTIDPGNGSVTREGSDEEGYLPQKFVAVLKLLMSCRGKYLTRQEIKDEVWGKEYDNCDIVTAAISRIRTTLGDPGRYSKTILTGRGSYALSIDLEIHKASALESKIVASTDRNDLTPSEEDKPPVAIDSILVTSNAKTYRLNILIANHSSEDVALTSAMLWAWQENHDIYGFDAFKSSVYSVSDSISVSSTVSRFKTVTSTFSGQVFHGDDELNGMAIAASGTKKCSMSFVELELNFGLSEILLKRQYTRLVIVLPKQFNAVNKKDNKVPLRHSTFGIRDDINVVPANYSKEQLQIRPQEKRPGITSTQDFRYPLTLHLTKSDGTTLEAYFPTSQEIERFRLPKLHVWKIRVRQFEDVIRLEFILWNGLNDKVELRSGRIEAVNDASNDQRNDTKTTPFKLLEQIRTSYSGENSQSSGKVDVIGQGDENGPEKRRIELNFNLNGSMSSYYQTSMCLDIPNKLQITNPQEHKLPIGLPPRFEIPVLPKIQGTFSGRDLIGDSPCKHEEVLFTLSTVCGQDLTAKLFVNYRE